jgi:4,5-dihydroxyphthalate decarboxylase
MSNGSTPLKLRTLLGDYKNVMPLKSGQVSSPRLTFDFADVKVPNTAFKRVVRDLEFDFSELAIATFLQAKAWNKPLAMLPAVVVGGKAQHASIVYNTDNGPLTPKDIVGRRVGIRASSQTTVMWVRGILKYEYGVDTDNVKWVTFEDPHVPEYKDPANCERAAAGKNMKDMLLSGEIVAACLAADDLKSNPKFKPLIPEPEAAAKAWVKTYQALPMNHVLVVKQSLLKEHPWAVQEIFRLVGEAKKLAGFPIDPNADPFTLGVEANRKGLEVAIKYATQQQLIPRSFTVDELFDDVTRALGK